MALQDSIDELISALNNAATVASANASSQQSTLEELKNAFIGGGNPDQAGSSAFNDDVIKKFAESVALEFDKARADNDAKETNTWKTGVLDKTADGIGDIVKRLDTLISDNKKSSTGMLKSMQESLKAQKVSKVAAAREAQLVRNTGRKAVLSKVPGGGLARAARGGMNLVSGGLGLARGAAGGLLRSIPGMARGLLGAGSLAIRGAVTAGSFLLSNPVGLAILAASAGAGIGIGVQNADGFMGKAKKWIGNMKEPWDYMGKTSGRKTWQTFFGGKEDAMVRGLAEKRGKFATVKDEGGNDIQKLLGFSGRPAGGFGRGPIERIVTSLFSYIGIQPETMKGVFDKFYSALAWFTDFTGKIGEFFGDMWKKYVEPHWNKHVQPLIDTMKAGFDVLTGSPFWKKHILDSERGARKDKAVKDAAKEMGVDIEGMNVWEREKAVKQKFIEEGNKLKRERAALLKESETVDAGWFMWAKDRAEKEAEIKKGEFNELERKRFDLEGKRGRNWDYWYRKTGAPIGGGDSLGAGTSEYVNDGAYINGKMYTFNPDDTFVAMTRKPENLDSDSIIGAITSSFDKGLEGLSRVMVNSQTQLAESLAQGGGSIINTSTSNTIVDNSNHTNVALMNQKSAIFG
jgi:hypothetical protein